jgi:plasmid stabilization system protein ParE
VILEFHPAAAAELAAAVSDGIRFGRAVALRLQAEVSRVALLLCTTPGIGEPITPTYRRFPLSGFPFALIYRVDGDVLLVVAFAHRRRRPRYWAQRI